MTEILEIQLHVEEQQSSFNSFLILNPSSSSKSPWNVNEPDRNRCCSTHKKNITPKSQFTRVTQNTRIPIKRRSMQHFVLAAGTTLIDTHLTGVTVRTAKLLDISTRSLHPITIDIFYLFVAAVLKVETLTIRKIRGPFWVQCGESTRQVCVKVARQREFRDFFSSFKDFSSSNQEICSQRIAWNGYRCPFDCTVVAVHSMDGQQLVRYSQLTA